MTFSINSSFSCITSSASYHHQSVVIGQLSNHESHKSFIFFVLS